MKQDSIVMSILQAPPARKLNAYLGAGCINQRIWNLLTGREATYGIEDYDLVYFDPIHTSKEAQEKIKKTFEDLFPDLHIECTNQARVHLWYEAYFGKKMEPLTSVEDGIDGWPTTASAIAAYLDEDDELLLYAPFGLRDLLSLTLRPNRTRITKAVYENKVEKWRAKWPELSVRPW